MDSKRFRFGLFEFDAASLELRREGAVVRLQSQPAQVLSCLIQRAGQVVSREELCKAVWGKETFVDFERGLNFCVAQVRSGLGDESATPRYVRTIPKHGYQFIAPVERIPERSGARERAAPTSASPRFFARSIVVACSAGLFVVIALTAGYWLRSARGSRRPPILAVLRFDNETSDPGMTRFSDALTDTVVEQLTSMSRDRYAVIGNAAILRQPREHRDLSAIATSLHAGYEVLGQVQSSGSQIRILAHLIRMPDQTHLWVVRLDRTVADPLSVESEVAQKIATEFSERVAKDFSGTPLPPAPSQ
jgi:DNA-binding winged helix-turn-helix (wHTH) protein/TolB-like protein